MRIEGPGKTSSTQGPKKTDKKKSGSDFGGMVTKDTPETAGGKPVTGVTGINQVDALLSLQEDEGGSGQSRQRAAEILKKLEQIRMGLLTGGIPKSTLQQLSQMVSGHRATVMDPALGEILDEIDLRAQVELAKYDRS
ncbi:MAG: flagellar assembly protein FliX [Alphaproteobacteria bacterium]|nr:flagellar assembly protein FliX [Alphaproteobacteria bacterium]